MSATANNFLFAKKEWPEKAQNVLYNFWLLSFEPGPNPARTRTWSLLPGPGPGPCRPLLLPQQYTLHFKRLSKAYLQQLQLLPRPACGHIYRQADVSKFCEYSDSELVLPSTFLWNMLAKQQRTLCHGHVASNVLRSALSGANHGL
jgi:hypothetical protein